MSKTLEKNSFIKNFDMDMAFDAPDWVNELRSSGLARFSELGIPTTKDEEWKYTSLEAISKRQFSFASNTSIIEKDKLAEYCDAAEINIVLVNGTFLPELSNLKALPKGMTIMNIADAAQSDPAIAGLFNKFDNSTEDALVSLNKGFMKDSVFVKIEDNTAVKGLVHIVHVTSTNEQDTASFPRSVISIGKSSEATVLESHLGLSQVTYFADPLTDIVLEENAKLTYCKAQDESREAFHIGNTRIWQERNSQLESFSMMVGAKLTRNNLTIVLNGEGAASTLNGLYMINGEQHVDNHTSVDHRLPNATSSQLYKGILNGKSRAVFNGKIFVKPIAQKTNSYQLNKNLLLGKDCRVDTKPQLEIFADDVKCTHGATIGQLNEDEIFYLQTRSIPKKQAVMMLSHGFVDEIISTIPSLSIRKKLHKLLAPSFAELQ